MNLLKNKHERSDQKPVKYVSIVLPLLFTIWLLAFFSPSKIFGQQMPFPPPNQLQVFSVQQLSFGSFYTGSSGGTVVVSPEGSRTSTGTVVLAGGLAYQAIFEVRLIPGRLVHIQYGPNAQLMRIGGSGMMTMQVGPSDKGSSFVTTGGHPFRNPVGVGGTLYVGDINANPAGNYEGSFSVTFIQE
ncbi:MAG: DUF4402 domain-containing protein [Sphingobacteriia bacterium]|nr:DUF4402 domain-containing protein [Sphingobacteriia bacterium]